MAITYDVPSNTITVVGGPFDFTDIFNADVAGAWGVVTMQGTSQFLFTAKLIIGDNVNATTFSDTLKTVEFSAAVITGNTQQCIRINDYATLTFGELIDAGRKSTRNGVHIYCPVTAFQYYPLFIRYTVSNNYSYLYGCTFTCNSTVRRDISVLPRGNVYNCFFNGVYLAVGLDPVTNNIMLANVYVALRSPSGTNQGNITVNECNRYIWFYVNGGTVTNIVGVGASEVGIRVASVTANMYLVNALLDLWTFNFSGSAGVECYRQYTVNLQVLDKAGTAINGATATWKNNAGANVFSVATGATGAIAEQTVSRGYYDQAHGNTLQDYGPFDLTVELAGYRTYTHGDIILDEPLDWRITLISDTDLRREYSRMMGTSSSPRLVFDGRHIRTESELTEEEKPKNIVLSTDQKTSLRTLRNQLYALDTKKKQFNVAEIHRIVQKVSPKKLRYNPEMLNGLRRVLSGSTPKKSVLDREIKRLIRENVKKTGENTVN